MWWRVAHVFKHQLSHKKIFNNLDNLSYIQRTSFRGNDTLYNEKVQFKLTYPVKNGRHKENIEFQVVINLSPIYLDNFRHDGEINIFALPTQSLSLWGAYFRPASSVCYFCFWMILLNNFQCSTLAFPSKSAYTTYWTPASGSPYRCRLLTPVWFACPEFYLSR